MHLILNFGGLVGGVWAAVTSGPSLISVLADQPLAGVPYLAFVAAGTYAAYLLLTILPVLSQPQMAGHASDHQTGRATSGIAR